MRLGFVYTVRELCALDGGTSPKRMRAILRRAGVEVHGLCQGHSGEVYASDLAENAPSIWKSIVLVAGASADADTERGAA